MQPLAPHTPPAGTRPRGTAGTALAAWALGEIATGVALIVAPGFITSILLDEPVAGAGATVARVAGFAIGALAIDWWIDSARLDAPRLRAFAPGFVAYNAGVGLLLLIHAGAAGSPALAAIAAVAHLLAGAACFAATPRRLDDVPTGRGTP